ncbi:hypothetical protein [Pseudozobellia thermophila]|nr:hypothetical protein [Pseudozobellia thermophila]
MPSAKVVDLLRKTIASHAKPLALNNTPGVRTRKNRPTNYLQNQKGSEKKNTLKDGIDKKGQ